MLEFKALDSGQDEQDGQDDQDVDINRGEQPGAVSESTLICGLLLSKIKSLILFILFILIILL
jgi:hypothetical protein